MAAPEPRQYDTLGHVDFSSKVSTASRLCDGALVLVDAVEGVCTQTVAVLRQAWLDRLRPILVIKSNGTEARTVMGKFFEGNKMEDDLRWREECERRMAEKQEKHADAAVADAPVKDDSEFQEKDEESTSRRSAANVIFTSAIDGCKFAQLFAIKLGMKQANLRRVLRGDVYIDPKTKKMISHKHLRGLALQPLCVQFVLEKYTGCLRCRCAEPVRISRTGGLLFALNLKIRSQIESHPPTALRSSSPNGSPFPRIIQATIDVVPAPATAQASRMPTMLYPDLHETNMQQKRVIKVKSQVMGVYTVTTVADSLWDERGSEIIVGESSSALRRRRPRLGLVRVRASRSTPAPNASLTGPRPHLGLTYVAPSASPSSAPRATSTGMGSATPTAPNASASASATGGSVRTAAPVLTLALASGGALAMIA
ncbi:P-loop containing nucleoside triphosphate hydrolase protein [Mycena pura]|uniref:P-loop containing nucleoside triphosphate hydrolase protein n=1 Tax=Mycena pura TaxID=153505 RepID=A0AAD6YFZ3_9AGAR|nr:P-loop containing nucleoside triphosphate hydrolase protein [Mycena pura]